MFTHQIHTTGQTNVSLLHCQPINQWTTTKGISMRRKWFIHTEIPPPPVPFTAPLYIRLTRIAAALAESTPIIPPPPFCGRTVSYTLDGPSTATFVVPTGVAFIYAECIGGGGDGDNAGLTVGGDGGGGGGYGAIGLTVSPGDTFSVVAGGPTVDSSFGTGPDAQGGAGSTPAGGTSNIGSFIANGQDGTAGGTPAGGDGGAAAGGGAGGSGGAAATNGSPGIFPGGGGGGGGAASADGASGASGQVTVTWQSTYGLNGDIHQYHNTGQTNYSIMHCTPINKYTTTKGISIRRIKYADPSDLRITQQYAEVFNVDPAPGSPRIRTTQYYFEVMQAPPGPAKFAALNYRRLTRIAAGLAQTTPIPIPPACSACVGRYIIRTQQSFTGTGQRISRTQTLIGLEFATCHCNGQVYPAQPH